LSKAKEAFLINLHIRFPKAPRIQKDRKVSFDRIISSVNEIRKSLPVTIRIEKEEKHAILDSDDFMISMSYEKKMPTSILVNEPHKNIATVNKVTNAVIKCVNTILGDGVKSAGVYSAEWVELPRKTVNLSKKLIGETKVVKIHKETKKLKPIGVTFEFRIKDKEFAFNTLSRGKRNSVLLLSRTVCKDRLPLNLLQKEYRELDYPLETVKRLSEIEV